MNDKQTQYINIVDAGPFQKLLAKIDHISLFIYLFI